LKIWLIKELHGKYVVGLAAEKFECTNQFTQKFKMRRKMVNIFLCLRYFTLIYQAVLSEYMTLLCNK
jgi:hypothetical protein